jgi:hypothetical protein
MSAQSTIVLNDGQTTPVAKSFLPRGAELRLAHWKETSGGISIGMPMITLSNKETTGSGGVSRTEARILLPILETISGDAGGYTPSPKVAYAMFFKGEFVCPARSTLANRKDILAFAKNLLAHAVMSEAVVDLNYPY